MRETLNDLKLGLCLLIVILALFYTHSGHCGDVITKDKIPAVRAIVYAADAFKIPRAILLAVCYHESAFSNRKGITHMDGGSMSYGICQVKLGTAQTMDRIYGLKGKATAEKLNSLLHNAYYAAAYLKYQKNKHKDWKLAIDAYNKFTPIHDHTRYVKAVLLNIGRFILCEDQIADITGEKYPTRSQRNIEALLLN